MHAPAIVLYSVFRRIPSANFAKQRTDCFVAMICQREQHGADRLASVRVCHVDGSVQCCLKTNVHKQAAQEGASRPLKQTVDSMSRPALPLRRLLRPTPIHTCGGPNPRMET